jgi:hypothetical protein
MTSCAFFPKSLVYYKSPAVSARIVDADTDEPIEGATVQVRWSALRHYFPEGIDSTNIHIATAETDTNGIFTTPAWGSVAVAREWHYYEFDPMVSFSKPGYGSSYRDNHNNQEFVTTTAMPFIPVKLELPSWAGEELELGRTNRCLHPTLSTNAVPEILSNSLAYYVVREDIIDGGRFVDTVDFPKVGYIRFTPELTITRIKSFSTNEPGGDFWHVINLPLDQSLKSGFSITLFQGDANQAAKLERKNIGHRNLLLMLDDKPLAVTYMIADANSPDSISTKYAPQTIYLPLRKHQNIQEINDALKKLVHSK